MIEILNEPLNWDKSVNSMRKKYYVDAYNVCAAPRHSFAKLTSQAIRDVEKGLGIVANQQVHVQLMDSKWGSRKPDEFLPNACFLAFDDHRYSKYDTSIQIRKDAFIRASCNDNRNSETPTIVGEWSLSPPDNDEKSDN